MKTENPQIMVDEFVRHHGDTPENLPAFWVAWKKAWELATENERKNSDARIEEYIAIGKLIQAAKTSKDV